MPIADPDQLITAFKNSGEFDKLRRELLASAQRSNGFEEFKARITEIALKRLESGQNTYTAPEMLHKELMGEINRYTFLERFASEVPMLSDSALKDGIHNSLQRILREDRGEKEPPQPPPAPAGTTPSQPSIPILPVSDAASAKEGEEPLKESGDVPPVPRASPPEASPDGMEIDAIDSGSSLTTAPATVESSPVPVEPAPSS